MKLNEILKNTSYDDTLFSEEAKTAIEQAVFIKSVKGKEVPYVKCQVREKDIVLTPEEVVRQLYLYKLIHEYGYPVSRIQLETPIHFGREVKRADITIMDKDRPMIPYIIVELKKPKLTDGKEQLKSYCNATGAPIGVWTNGEQISCYNRKDPNFFEMISDIPKATQKLSEILSEKLTYGDLKTRDKISKEKRSLRNLIKEMEDEVLASAGVDSFEEIFKLIFAKLYDELICANDNTAYLKFRNSGDTDFELKEKIQGLFDDAKEKWEGVFPDESKILLSPSHLAVCVSTLQDIKLFNNNLDVVDDAFEYLMSKGSKGEKGQYFTPRYVIDMCVKMMNPSVNDKIIDTACGSSGFVVHSIFKVWKDIRREKGLPEGDDFTASKRTEEESNFVRQNVFAIDFDEKTVRVARTLNLIAGDGQTNVLHLNTLDYSRWNEITKQEHWNDTYNEGFKKLRKLQPKGVKDFSKFEFDLVMANPPFAGDIKEQTILSHYELAKNDKGKWQKKVGRDILFIERNLNFLKPGGRMAVVLPQGRFNNSSDKYIREFIAERCRILAVVGLHGNVFKPHTGTKTSVLLVQKWDDELCPKKDDYPIFFATMQKPSKDNSGEKIYVKDENGEIVLDQHNHFIVDHDLYNHNGMTNDGIAEAFVEFAKKEGLSFFRLSPSAESFNEIRYKALMDGLECSEIMMRDIDDHLFRIEAEYFQKKYQKSEQLLSKYENLDKYTKKIECGPFGSNLLDTEYVNEGILVVRPFNLIDCTIENERLVYISENTIKENNLKKYGRGIILFSRVGDIKVGYSNRDLFTISPNIIIADVENDEYAKYFSIFFNTKYGNVQIERELKVAAQPTISTGIISKLKVPMFKSLLKLIVSYLNKYESYTKQSNNYYEQAEKILNEKISINLETLSDNNINIKTFSNSFDISGRLDAEYYQLKYDQLFEILSHFKTHKLGGKDGIVNIEKSIEPGSDAYCEDGIPFVRVSDVTKFDITSPEIHLPTNIVTNPSKLYPKKNTILFSKDGSVGIAYKLEKDEKIITSGALLHLSIKNPLDILPDYLTLILNSPIVQLQAERDSSGAIIQHWKPSEIENVLIPILDIKIQKEISQNVQESFALRRKSKQLLEYAKQAVEIAIKKDEKTAIEWLKEKGVDG